MRPLSEAPYIDPMDPEVVADPAARVEVLRRESPVLRSPLGALVVSRQHVQELLRDRSLRSALPYIVELQGITEGPMLDSTRRSLLGLEGEDHTRLRRLVSRSFTPRAADGHRPYMRELLGSLIAGFSGRGECEFMGDFADHYPVQVIAHLMGVPEEDHPRFARWGDSLTHLLSMELDRYRDEVTLAQEEMGEYLADMVAARKDDPRDDLVSELIAARDGTDRLNDEELLSLLGGLLFAGYDTTRNQLGVAMTIFAERPDDWARLAADPGLAPGAVEEVMRFNGVVSGTARVAGEDVEVGGWLIPAGSLVSLSLASANRDPDVYAAPTAFDMDLEREAHVSFGGGAHHCLGANLARAEMQEALPRLAAAMPDMVVAEPPRWRSPLGGIAGPQELHLRFRPSA